MQRSMSSLKKGSTIEPRRQHRCEVKVNARVPDEPSLHRRMPVRGVIVEDDVNRKVARHTPLHLAHEREELLKAARDDIERANVVPWRL